MSGLSKAHDLAYRLLCELEELKGLPAGPETEERLVRLHKAACELLLDICELVESQI